MAAALSSLDTMLSEAEPLPSKRPASDLPFVGFGKLILFGEHFVVYKAPALVGAVSACTTCSVELSSAKWSHGLILEDNR